jgi:hypothetical protein
MTKAAVRIVVALFTTLAFLAACNPASGGSPNIALYDITSGKVPVNPGDPAIDFGTAHQTRSPYTQLRTFSVENTGTADLVLTGSGAAVAITGDTANFSITTQPPQSIPAGGSVSFDIVLTATATTGTFTRNATIGIDSDDPDLASLSFDVTGTDQHC